jgi:hypothetical protein
VVYICVIIKKGGGVRPIETLATLVKKGANSYFISLKKDNRRGFNVLLDDLI